MSPMPSTVLMKAPSCMPSIVSVMSPYTIPSMPMMPYPITIFVNFYFNFIKLHIIIIIALQTIKTCSDLSYKH